MVEKTKKSGQKKQKLSGVKGKIASESARLSFSLRDSKDKKPRKSLRTFLSEETERAGDHFSEHFVRRLGNVKEVRLWVVEWLLLVLLVFFLALAQIVWYLQAHQNMAYAAGGNYFEGSIGAVNSLNPLYASTESEKILARLMFANIVSPDVSGHEKGDLARSITKDESSKVWTVELRDGMKWSDGEPIGADDVIYTVNLLKDKTAKTTVAVDFAGTELEKVDEKTVKFTLPSAYLDFTDSLEIPVLPAHILKDVKPALLYENEFSMKPVVSGPFVFNVIQTGEDVVDTFTQQVYLNRNENYHGNLAKLDSFILSVFRKPEDVANALKTGEIMGTASLTVGQAEGFNVQASRRTSVLNGGVYAFINNETVGTKAVRQAIQRGVDMKVVREGFDESRMLDYPILENQGKDLEFPALPEYSLEEAKKMLTEAGYSYSDEGKLQDDESQPVELNVASRGGGEIGYVTDRFVGQLEKLGFQVNLTLPGENESGKDFFTAVVYPRDYDILIYEVDLGVSADPFAYYSSTQKQALNFSNYSERLVDDALLSARTTTSAKLRQAKYNFLLKHFVDDVPAIGIYRSSLDYYYSPEAMIYSENVQMTDKFDRFVDVTNWAVNKRVVEMTP